jgi:hypothetical protein
MDLLLCIDMIYSYIITAARNLSIEDSLTFCGKRPQGSYYKRHVTIVFAPYPFNA